MWTNPKRNYATHRDVGDIPGCVPAVDVFIERTIDEVHAILAADGYQKVWDDYRFGVLAFREWTNHPIHRRPLLPAFGNPAKASSSIFK